MIDLRTLLVLVAVADLMVAVILLMGAGHGVLSGGIVVGTLPALIAAMASQGRPTAGRAPGRVVLVVSFALGAAAFYFRGIAATFAAEPMQAFAAPTMLQSSIFIAAC